MAAIKLTMIENIKSWWQGKDARQKDEALNSTIDEPVPFYRPFSPRLDCAVFHVSPISGDKVDILLAVYPHFLDERIDRYNAVFVLHLNAQRRKAKYDGMSYHFAYVKVVDAYTLTEPDAEYPDLYKAFETDNDINSFKHDFLKKDVNIGGLIEEHHDPSIITDEPISIYRDINNLYYDILVLQEEVLKVLTGDKVKVFAYLIAIPTDRRTYIKGKNSFLIGVEYIGKRCDGKMEGLSVKEYKIKFFEYADSPVYEDLKEVMVKVLDYFEFE